MVATPDLATVAHGFGASGALVRSDDELAKQLDGYDWSSVRLLDVKVTQDVVDVSSVMGNDVVVR